MSTLQRTTNQPRWSTGGRVHADEIRFRAQIIQLPATGMKTPLDLGVFATRRITNRHSHRGSDLCHSPTDLPKPNNPQRRHGQPSAVDQ
nr:hypothetical protein [Microlunatus endophyticus]